MLLFFLIMKSWTWGTDIRCNQANVNLCHQSLHSHSDLIKKHLHYGLDAGAEPAQFSFLIDIETLQELFTFSAIENSCNSGFRTTWSHLNSAVKCGICNQNTNLLLLFIFSLLFYFIFCTTQFCQLSTFILLCVLDLLFLIKISFI